MIKIKICDLAPRSACSYYRSLGPLSKLNKINPEISVEYLEAVSWTALSDADILFLARPVSPEYIEAIELAQSFGVKVWSDFDDALDVLPDDNPGKPYFCSDQIVKNLKIAIKHSEIVTVSTQALKDLYSPLNPYIHVVENAFNDYNYPFKKRENKSNYISWRGSATHRNDLLSIRNSLKEIAEKNKEWFFAWIGGGDLWYLSTGENTVFFGEVEIVRYNRLLYNLQPAIHISPLMDTPFNRCKSNISWLESTWAGAPCLAPKIPEFEKPGCVNYTDNFGYLLEKLIKSRTFRQENYLQSFEYIKNNLLLSQINKKRIEIIEDTLI